MIRGGLFTRYFLEEGIIATDAYRQQDAGAVTEFADAARRLWAGLSRMQRPSEAETEHALIHPVLQLLGWERLPQQEPGRGRRDVADELLFLTPDARDTAASLPQTADRFRHGVVVVENEARDTPLDRASGNAEAPSSQVLRYLSRAETASDGAVHWGLLTSGRFWRLYSGRAAARAEGFIEIDLPGILGDTPPAVPEGADALHWIKVFLLIFGRDALAPIGTGGQTFLDQALAEGRLYEQRVTAALSAVVFDRVFPNLLSAMAHELPGADLTSAAWREEARQAGLRLLYRLLFLFYAEDRDLLPVSNDGYRPYSLRELRLRAAEVRDQQRRVSRGMKTWWPRLAELFHAIAIGSPDMGLPPYNGGLFEAASAPMLAGLALPDAFLAEMLDDMSRVGEPGARRWINYRDLSVQHLGSIYERLLERELAVDAAGAVMLRPNPFARKTTGSYYTPDELVRLVLRRTVGPLLEERRKAFTDKAAELGRDRRDKTERVKLLREVDPAEAFVGLRVCDPAMGSGHFLVSLVDYLADQVLDAIAAAPALVPWADAPYRSPLAERIVLVREQIRATAANNGWQVREDQLDDRHLVRRIILKRVIYGVDLNPMAVELAKLSLWLHSFTVGAPLSFLDHHLRVGDSLFGERVGQAIGRLGAEYGMVSMGQTVVKASLSASAMATIEALTDADIAEVRTSADTFATVEEATAELRAFLDLWHASIWLTPETPADNAGRGLLFGGAYGDPVAIAAGKMPCKPPADAVDVRRGGRRVATAAEAYEAAMRFLHRARSLSKERRFLHWEASFPGVWTDWERTNPPGGFDAVIGNPPWDRMKMQEVEWFAARVPEVARTDRSVDRARMIKALLDKGGALAEDYRHVAWTADASMRVARQSGVYPLLSGGDTNLYSLFVERSLSLLRPDGIAGLVVPSGIAADLGAAPFFRSISTAGRLSTLLDFENRPVGPDKVKFFPDVYYRFKFCTLIAGAPDRRFPAAACAFFQTNVDEALATAFDMTPEQFAAVNPNTGTAAMFRTQTDAVLTLSIYQRLPILLARAGGMPDAIWPMKYVRMLDMANDSARFKLTSELADAGAYPVTGRAWERGAERWVPLFEGKMVQAYDHRAASVAMTSGNRYREAMTAPAEPGQHLDPAWENQPQFWVSEGDVALPDGLSSVLAFKDITSPTNIRGMIAMMLPRVAAGHTLPLILPALPGNGQPDAEQAAIGAYRQWAPLLLANFNSVALDYVARLKLQGNHLTLYIVEQLPVVPPAAFARAFGPRTAEDIIREDVLHLTYTAHDMKPFAVDQGYDGPPFSWDDEDRLRRRARLDAVFFRLYGLSRPEAEYVLSTFPIVRREEEQRYQGRFRSRDLILRYMAALEAGAPDALVVG